MQEWVENKRYLSHEIIINEIIEMMALYILRNIIGCIKTAKNFAIIADETQDIGGCEQLAVSLRWVDECYLIHKDDIGLIEVENMDGSTLESVLKDVLIRCELQLSDCRGQAYDGASNMSGCFKGIASHLQKEPTALYSAGHS